MARTSRSILIAYLPELSESCDQRHAPSTLKMTNLFFEGRESDPCFLGDIQSAGIVPGFTWTHTILLQTMLGKNSH